MKILFKISFLVFLTLFISACAVTALKKEQELYDQEQYAQLVKIELNCKANDTGCNKRNLLKGNACYFLAKQAQSANKVEEAKQRYDCAIKHLHSGIAWTQNWDITDRDQNYENLCESLRNRQDYASGQEAGLYTSQLLETANEFRKLAAAHPAAIYFYNSARFTSLRPQIIMNSPAACPEINDILTDIETVSVEPASRYFNLFQRFKADVAGAKAALPDCS